MIDEQIIYHLFSEHVFDNIVNNMVNVINLLNQLQYKLIEAKIHKHAARTNKDLGTL